MLRGSSFLFHSQKTFYFTILGPLGFIEHSSWSLDYFIIFFLNSHGLGKYILGLNVGLKPPYPELRAASGILWLRFFCSLGNRWIWLLNHHPVLVWMVSPTKIYPPLSTETVAVMLFGNIFDVIKLRISRWDHSVLSGGP